MGKRTYRHVKELENIIISMRKAEMTLEEAIDQVVVVCTRYVYEGGLLCLFGTGHSYMIVEEPLLSCRWIGLRLSHSGNGSNASRRCQYV